MMFYKSLVAVVLLIWASIGHLEAIEVNITVSKAPKIVYQAEVLNHPEGTNATLVCSIGSGELDNLSYEWLKDDKRVVTSSRLRVSIAPENFNSILRVIDLKPNDSGAYTCVAKNSFGQDKISIKLFVKVQLKWTIEPKDVEVSVGRMVHVPCKADGQPEPRIEWTKVGETGGQFVGSELRFASINQDDAGQYECRARNGVEKDLVMRIKVDVLGKYRESDNEITLQAAKLRGF